MTVIKGYEAARDLAELAPPLASGMAEAARDEPVAWVVIASQARAARLAAAKIERLAEYMISQTRNVHASPEGG